ncbi:OmpA family protein [Pseudogemmobacter hezensis]|uniref:OmpA family protein n=1 Tax=Pseudogemmobacter hezensis TaxID=2737662 RepID=UPI00345B4C05
MTLRPFLIAFSLLAPGILAAQEAGFTPQMPFPVQNALALPAEYDSYALPVGVWQNGQLPVEMFEGQVDRRAWQLDAGRASLLEVMAPLREQLIAAGYQIVLDCDAPQCGGFDFRFSTQVLPEPEMHVDLNEFRFVAARRGPQAVGLLVSRSASAAFVQIITVGDTALPGLPVQDVGMAAAPPPVTSPQTTPPQTNPAPRPPSDPALQPETVARLDAGLPFALDDLVFDTGAATLSHQDYPSLAALAAWIGADPGRRVILVGHTDLSGPLQGNIALSKRRAEAVRAALIADFGVPAARISAEGAGPLAPRADNATEEGRQKNRRVEAIPAPT